MLIPLVTAIPLPGTAKGRFNEWHRSARLEGIRSRTRFGRRRWCRSGCLRKGASHFLASLSRPVVSSSLPWPSPFWGEGVPHGSLRSFWRPGFNPALVLQQNMAEQW